MKYLIDTDWVIAALKGRQDALTLLTTLSADGLAISLITYGEVYEGIYFGSDPARNEAGFQAFLQGVEILLLDEDILKQFAQLRGQLRHAGNIIGDFDLLIAATAIHCKLILVTLNVKHFGRVPGLNLY